MDEVEEILAQLIDAPQLLDEEVWLGMFTAVSGHPGCPSAQTAVAWADTGLTAFRDRFRVEDETLSVTPTQH